MTPEQRAALDELLTALRGAYMVKASPPQAYNFVTPPPLSELIDTCAAQLPAKYRAHVLKLERQIRASLLGWQTACLDVAHQLGAAGDDPGTVAARQAYLAGMLNGGLIHFTGQRPPATKPTPPPGGRTPRENR